MPINKKFSGQATINHVCLVLDASSSMYYLRDTVIKVGDNLKDFLSKRSVETGQETRLTVIVFADKAECVISDMDVLRAPSLAEIYEPYGNTALVDASVLALDDMSQTFQKYGDHAFLMFVITDGEENASKALPTHLKTRIASLPDNWTLAAMVPNTQGKIYAKDCGFPPSNIEIWDASSKKGMEETGRRLEAATDSYFTARATGTRSMTNIFSTGVDAVNPQAVAAAGLVPLGFDKYTLVHVPEKSVIKDFVEAMGHKYVVGNAYYELVKREEIQTRKGIALLDKKDDRVYMGDQARDLLGLPNMNVRVSPDKNPLYRIFVQSTSTNRILPEHTKLLVLK